jgi:hypothetical protein
VGFCIGRLPTRILDSNRRRQASIVCGLYPKTFLHLELLTRKPNAEPLFESLYSILSQPRDHDVSGEVAEAVGYEDMDMIMEILQNRETLVKQVRFDLYRIPFSHCSRRKSSRTSVNRCLGLPIQPPHVCAKCWQ